MKAKIILIPALLMLSSFIAGGEMADYCVGVKSGDWIKYEETITDVDTGVSLVTSLEVYILNVSETIVKVEQITIAYGIRNTETGTIDVVSGAHDSFLVPALIIPAINPEIPAYLIGSDIIDSGETTMTYAGESRVVLYGRLMHWTGVVYENRTYYWDKQTGVLMEWFIPGTIRTFNLKATETNMWGASPFGLPIDPTAFFILIVVALVLAVTVPTVAFFMTRRTKKTTEEIKPPPTSTDTTQQILDACIGILYF